MTNINVSRIATGNNTVRTAWDPATLKTIKTISAGRLGLKGSRRGSSYAAELVGRELGRVIEATQFSNVNIYLSGKLTPISSAIRGLRVSLRTKKIVAITDVTPKPFNGCRARKPRRV